MTLPSTSRMGSWLNGRAIYLSSASGLRDASEEGDTQNETAKQRQRTTQHQARDTKSDAVVRQQPRTRKAIIRGHILSWRWYGKCIHDHQVVPTDTSSLSVSGIRHGIRHLSPCMRVPPQMRQMLSVFTKNSRSRFSAIYYIAMALTEFAAA